MRVGLNADERDSREQIFGKNAINIQQKSLFQLLIDEVRPLFGFVYRCSQV
jgi:cation-transporting ATPase 13A2